MAVDGVFLKLLKEETAKQLNNSKVDKIYQPSKDELVILFRSFGPALRLYINVKPSAARFNFIDSIPENPSSPPMFCMLLRKKLCGARFIGIEDNGFERICIFVFESHNELGDTVVLKLAVELIGKQPNVILVGSDGKITDSIRRSDIESSVRIIQPGAVYKLPEKKEKLSLLDADTLLLTEKINSGNGYAWKAVVDTVDGISPLVAREILFRAGMDLDTALPLNIVSADKIINALRQIRSEITGKGFILLDESERPMDFSYIKIKQYGNITSVIEKESLSELLDSFFSERDKKERKKALSADLCKNVSTLKNRALRKMNIRTEELKKCDGSEKFRIYGELIKANIHRLQRGDRVACVENYYDDMKMVTIPLNTALSPAENAQKYFKEYKKLCNAAATLGKLIDESRNEYNYFESVEDELSRAETIQELAEIKSELTNLGYLKTARNGKKTNVGRLKPLEFLSPDGYKVLVGRNNVQNDELTFRIAAKTDIWLHTKDIPGSHTVIICNGTVPPDRTVEYAARMAAFYSKARNSLSVPVDYTMIKFVKKPAGAKPGMVIFTNNHTAFVKPWKDENI